MEKSERTFASTATSNLLPITVAPHHSMPTPTDNFAAARARIATAYDPAVLEAAGTRLVATLAEHFRHVESRDAKVLNWAEPAALCAKPSWLVPLL
jgi:hypothetical protein